MASDEVTTADKKDLERLSEFRWRLRTFLRFSEDLAREHGVTALHYQLMLHTQGFPERTWATVGELAERLQAQPHGVVALITRCEEAGLVRRKPHKEDRRQVEVHLLAKGRKLLVMLAALHRDQLTELALALESLQKSEPSRYETPSDRTGTDRLAIP